MLVSLSSKTASTVMLLLSAASICALLYVSATWRASQVSDVSWTGGDVERAIELTLDRGAVGYTGG